MTLSIMALNTIMLSVVTKPNKLNVVILSFVMLCVIVLNVVELNVVAPNEHPKVLVEVRFRPF